jgi:VanZ family protein
MFTNRFKLIFWRLTSLFWAIVLLYLCLTPAPPQVYGPLGWDKLQHAGAFGLFAFFIFNALRSQNVSLGVSSWTAALTASFSGGVIELLQELLTSNRTGELLDFFADTAGATLVVLLLYLKSKIRG